MVLRSKRYGTVFPNDFTYNEMSQVLEFYRELRKETNPTLVAQVEDTVVQRLFSHGEAMLQTHMALSTFKDRVVDTLQKASQGSTGHCDCGDIPDPLCEYHNTLKSMAQHLSDKLKVQVDLETEGQETRLMKATINAIMRVGEAVNVRHIMVNDENHCQYCSGKGDPENGVTCKHDENCLFNRLADQLAELSHFYEANHL